jgi:hypothetical protein
VPSLFSLHRESWPGPYRLEELRSRRGRWEAITADPRAEEGACTVHDLAAGDPRGSGADRLYLLRRFQGCSATRDEAEVVEYAPRSGDVWRREVVTRLQVARDGVGYGWKMLGVWRAREGRPAVYVTNALGDWYELSHDDGVWQVRGWDHLVWTQWGDAPACAAGQGRNDGRLRVYCVGCCGGLDELTYERGHWMRTGRMKLQPPWALSSVAVGPARNDGMHRVYVRRFGAADPDELMELTWRP